MRNGLVIIAGMHRSGTSALSGALSIAGVNFGKKLVPADGFNPTGYYERPEIMACHDLLLRKLASRWDDPRPLPDNWEGAAAAQSAELQLAQLYLANGDRGLVYGVKDPRISRLFPVWKNVATRLQADLRVIVPLRPPLECAASLGNRNQMMQHHALALWLRYNLEVERHSRGLPRIIQSYAGLLADPPGCVDRLISGLDLSIGALDSSKVPAIARLVDGRFRRHILPSASGTDTGQLGLLCDEVYGLLENLDPSASRRLDEIYRLLDDPELRSEMYAAETGSRIDTIARLEHSLEKGFLPDLWGAARGRFYNLTKRFRRRRESQGEQWSGTASLKGNE